MLCQHQHYWSDRFSMRSCPERAYILAFFCPPPLSLGDENPVTLHFFAYAEIIFARMKILLRFICDSCNNKSKEILNKESYLFSRLKWLDLTIVHITDHDIGIKLEAGLQRRLHNHRASPPKLVRIYISNAIRRNVFVTALHHPHSRR